MHESIRGRVFFLDLYAGRILSANPDGSDLTSKCSSLLQSLRGVGSI